MLKNITTLYERFRRRNGAVNTLHAAQGRGELVMFYQPKVDMTSGLIMGFEALLRWKHPTLGVLQPAAFDQALKTGKEVVIDLGPWVIEEAIKQIVGWKKLGIKIPVSVNMMSSELIGDGFLDWIGVIFEEYSDISPSMLELEIIESSILTDYVQVIAAIKKCRSMGMKIALDDFGTAYSSLSYIRNLPADHLKIDKSFVKGLVNNQQDQDVVKTVISLANSFNCKVIAEGVESIEDGLMLLNLGCEYAQGYVIARPMAAMEIEGWIKQYGGCREWINYHYKSLLQYTKI
jgi:EAL domain-containing protein (putative c-di-GMP-specific phosphodiesterase class I)